MKIIAYTYDADVHCVGCAQARFSLHEDGHTDDDTDEHGISDTAVDCEGNDIRPVFSTQVVDMSSCGTCRKEIT